MSFYSQFAEHYEKIFPFREEVYGFLRRHMPHGGRRVLDVGCGTGHYCGRFAAEGFEVLGFDLDEEMVRSARATYPDATFSVLDMTAVDTLTGAFDLAFCIGNVAAHADRAGLRKMIHGISTLLVPGGVWILQTVNWDFLLKRPAHIFPPRQLGSGLPCFLREYRDISADGVRFLTRLEEDGEVLFAGEVKLFPITAADCIRLHGDHGLRARQHAADFAGKPFSPDVESGSVFVFGKPRQ